MRQKCKTSHLLGKGSTSKKKSKPLPSYQDFWRVGRYLFYTTFANSRLILNVDEMIGQVLTEDIQWKSITLTIDESAEAHHSTESVDEHSRSREQADRNRSEYQSVKNKGNPNSAHIAERTVTTLRTVGRSRGKRLVGNPSGIKDDCHLRHVRIMMRHILVIPIPLHSVSLVGRSA